jgi:hypothetical protein
LASSPESVQEAKKRILKTGERVERSILSICSISESYAEAYK